MAFFHIPLLESYESPIDKGPDGQRLIVGNRYEGNGASKCRFSPPSLHTNVQTVNSQFFSQALQAQKELIVKAKTGETKQMDEFWDDEFENRTEGRSEVKVVVNGHCHLSNDCRRIRGVWLCFGGGGSCTFLPLLLLCPVLSLRSVVKLFINVSQIQATGNLPSSVRSECSRSQSTGKRWRATSSRTREQERSTLCSLVLELHGEGRGGDASMLYDMKVELQCFYLIQCVDDGCYGEEREAGRGKCQKEDRSRISIEVPSSSFHPAASKMHQPSSSILNGP